MSALEELAEYLAAGESIPLSWVVQYGSQFREIWLASRDPRFMIKIAARVASQRELVLVSIALAETALKHSRNTNPKAENSDWSRDDAIAWEASDIAMNVSRDAIDTARLWTNGKVSPSEVHDAGRAAALAGRTAEEFAERVQHKKEMLIKSTVAAFAAYAATSAAYAVKGFHSDAGHYAGNVVAHTTTVLAEDKNFQTWTRHARRVARDLATARRRVAKIIRDNTDVTLQKIVAAAREARS